MIHQKSAIVKSEKEILTMARVTLRGESLKKIPGSVFVSPVTEPAAVQQQQNARAYFTEWASAGQAIAADVSEPNTTEPADKALIPCECERCFAKWEASL